MNISPSIKTKIFFVILIPAVMLLFVIYLDYGHLSSLGRSAERILSKNYKSIHTAQQIHQLLEANRNHILTTMFQDRKAGLKNLSLDRSISPLLGILRDNITEAGEKHIIDTLFEDYNKYVSFSPDMVNIGKKPMELKDGYLKFVSLTASLISDLNDLVLINEKAMEMAEQETRQMAAKALRYSMGLLIAAILFTVIFSYLLSSRISRPLTKLSQSLAIIKEGKGPYPRIPVTSHDEIGFLTSEFNRLFERLKIYDQLSADMLTAEKLKVRQVEEARSRFIADLSHQLKTPMTSLSMSVGILCEKTDELGREKHLKLLETAREECARLSALINELVDIAKLDAGLKPRTTELLDIEKVIHECLRPLLNQAGGKNIHLEINVEAGLPLIAIDSLRFPWVITNLVGNALRYTDPGGRVILQVNKHGNRFYFRCIDAGAGIEERFLHKIFARFTQFSEREKSGAIGLGLAIVKEIIEQHCGDITVASKVGEGTTFTFWIPMVNEESDDKNTID